MKTFKHLFTTLLLLCAAVATAHDFKVNGIYYNITDATNKTVEVTYRHYWYDTYDNEYTGNVVIPESVTYNATTYSVTSIVNDAFRGCSGLTSVEIPNSVTSIEYMAFYGCSGLTSVVIGNGVTSIGDDAFKYCTGLKTVYNFSNLTLSEGSSNNGYVAYYADKVYNALNGSKEGDFIFGKPNDVNTLLYYLGNDAELTLPADYKGENYAIGASVFKGNTTITSVIIGNSVTSIGSSAFYNCSGLTSIEIPNSVTSIIDGAFSGCSGLTSITVAAGNAKYDSRENCNAIIETESKTLIVGCKNTIIPNGVKSIGHDAFYGCRGLTCIEIPNSVTSIGDYAFKYCTGLTSIEIPNSVTSIGNYAFERCTGLTSIEIPNSVTSIGTSAFNGCSGLTSVTIGNSVTSIGGSAFYNCSGLTSITLPNSVTSIGGSAFSGCSGLANVSIGTGVQTIGNYTFNGCTSLKNLRIEDGEGVLTLGYNNTYNSYGTGEGLFYDCPLDTLYLGRDLSYSTTSDYGYSPFYNKSKLTSVIIGDNVTSIGSSAFNGCTRLTSIVIPNSVTSIGGSAFSGCTGLTSIEIPNSVTSIGDGAFGGCKGLTSVEFNAENCTSMGSSSYTVFGGCAALSTVIIGENVKNIPAYAFYNCSGLTSITIPNSVTSIGNYAFNRCSGLTSIVIPNSVTSIGSCAFYYCSGLTSVTIGDSVTSIGSYAFEDCSGITSVTIPNSVTSIGDGAFGGCKGLTSVEIPNSVTSIGGSAFSVCSGLTSVEFNAENCTSMGSYSYPVFDGCAALSTITIGENVKNIPDYAFFECSGLTSVEIPNSVTSIGDYAFNGCTGLTSIEIPNSVTSIGDYAFSGCSSLANVSIGTGVQTIGNYTFNGCTSLKNLRIEDGEGVLTLKYNIYIIGTGMGLFYDCPLETLYLGRDLSYSTSSNYGYSPFYNKSTLTSVIIGDNVTSIGDFAFYGCTGLTSITIPNSVTSIGEDAFKYCTGLKTVYNFSNLTLSKRSTSNGYVAYYADKVCNAPNGSIEDGFIFDKPKDVNTLVGYLGNATELTLPANYKGGNYDIGADVFKGNTTITSIEIPNSVTSIGTSAFYGCTGLEKVYINDLAAWCGIDFGSADANPLHYAKNLYLNGELLTSLTIPAEIAEVKDYAFYNCRGVINIDIVDGVKSIGNSAFYGCSDLETLYISSTIESIGDNAFTGCNNIFEIRVGSKKAVTASENIFSSDAYNNACLYVPEGRKFAYEKTAPWSNFYIAEMDFTGIDEMPEEVKAESGKVKTIYDLQGRVVETPTSGIYIINGKKVLVK